MRYVCGRAAMWSTSCTAPSARPPQHGQGGCRGQCVRCVLGSVYEVCVRCECGRAAMWSTSSTAPSARPPQHGRGGGCWGQCVKRVLGSGCEVCVSGPPCGRQAARPCRGGRGVRCGRQGVRCEVCMGGRVLRCEVRVGGRV